eukprot:TRINITY_DN67460_c3_g2_i1.p1 TRINITY_DN67460_c3_g2~~TRINITY_DN67460_c3_g2_i1.p1  ORF type:complete len:256 (-),score=23.00 TRINITY_DN67460_c3_g2_i1:107-874(-)
MLEALILDALFAFCDDCGDLVVITGALLAFLLCVHNSGRKGHTAASQKLTALQALIPHTYCRTLCTTATPYKIQRVDTNNCLWRRHCNKVDKIAKETVSPSSVTVRTEIAPKLEQLVGEAGVPKGTYVYLFHGTSMSIAKEIVKNGFKPSVGCRALYGKGTYFTDQWCKAAQYALAHDDGCVIYARVMLGNVFMLSSSKDKEVNGYVGLDACPTGYHSLCAPPGTRHFATQVHTEFIIKDGWQCYPEYLISVKGG